MVRWNVVKRRVMAHREFTDALYAQLARLGRAIASQKRVELLGLLGQGEQTVEVLADEDVLRLLRAFQALGIGESPMPNG